MEIDNENVVQAVVIMDNFNNNFNPITKTLVSFRVQFTKLLFNYVYIL